MTELELLEANNALLVELLEMSQMNLEALALVGGIIIALIWAATWKG